MSFTKEIKAFNEKFCDTQPECGKCPLYVPDEYETEDMTWGCYLDEVVERIKNWEK